MIPTVGDIYCAYSRQLEQYTACQVTELKESDDKSSQILAAIVQLDWSGDEPLQHHELDQLKPLVRSFYFWNDDWDHRFVEAEIPADYILVGNIPPIVTEPCYAYDTYWDIGNSLYEQRKWEAIDEERRQRFKKARNDEGTITIAGMTVKKNTSTLRNFSPGSDIDIATLEQLYCLTHIEMNHFTATIIPFLQRNPFIHELHIDQHDVTELDFSGTHLNRLIIRQSFLQTLTLNREMEFLSLVGEQTDRLHIYADGEGHTLTLSVASQLPVLTGLEQLQALLIHGIEQLNLQDVTATYPALRELRLWGKPGTLSGVSSIARLEALQFFSTFDVFGFAGDEFPDPSQLPQLQTLWLTSLPADAAKSIKARYKKLATTTLDLEITKPRKPEWLAENLNNPFRDWDGRDHIKPADAKKAATLYKQCLKNICDWAQHAHDSKSLMMQLTAMIEMYTEVFNTMDARSGCIDTIEREEIATALNELLDGLQKQLDNQHASTLEIDRQALEQVFERTREF